MTNQQPIEPASAQPGASEAASEPLALYGLVALGMALAILEIATGWVAPWGLFQDEFYYWAGSQRPGLGYVDHPPLAPWLLGATQALFGDGRLSFAVVPALCAAATVVITGWLARTFGADRFGQLLAGLAVAVAPVFLIFFSFYSVNAIELFLWTLACAIAAERMRGGDERWWLAFGVVAGVALLNKHTFGLLGMALGIGLLATPLRADLRSRWLWWGGAAALLIALPNIVWNAVNDWPSLTFYAGRGVGILEATIADALEIQIIGLNPASVLLWLPGVIFLLFSRTANRYRPLGIAFLVLFTAILLSEQKRGDRIAGIYPVAMAAGTVVWCRWHPKWRTAMRCTLATLIFVSGVLLSPAALPILSPQVTEDYFEAIDEKPEIEAGDIGARIPLYLSGRLEWERFATEVIDVWRALPDEQRNRAVILAPHWVFASAIEYYARNDPHPPVVSPHNAYYFWRHEAGGRDIAVSVGIHEEVLSEFFDEVRPSPRFECGYCVAFRPNLSISVSYRPRRPIQELIDDWRDFNILPAAALSRRGAGELVFGE